MLTSSCDLYWLISWVSLVCWAAESLKFYCAPWISPPKALISLFFLSITPFNLSSSCDNKAILFSYSENFLLVSPPNYWNFLLSYSYSLQVILSSLFNLPICEADNLRFYWASLISSPSWLFSFKSFCIFILYVSD